MLQRTLERVEDGSRVDGGSWQGDCDAGFEVGVGQRRGRLHPGDGRSSRRVGGSGRRKGWGGGQAAAVLQDRGGLVALDAPRGGGLGWGLRGGKRGRPRGPLLPLSSCPAPCLLALLLSPLAAPHLVAVLGLWEAGGTQHTLTLTTHYTQRAYTYIHDYT